MTWNLMHLHSWANSIRAKQLSEKEKKPHEQIEDRRVAGLPGGPGNTTAGSGRLVYKKI